MLFIECVWVNVEVVGVGDWVCFEVSDFDVLVGKKFDFVMIFVVIYDVIDL